MLSRSLVLKLWSCHVSPGVDQRVFILTVSVERANQCNTIPRRGNAISFGLPRLITRRRCNLLAPLLHIFYETLHITVEEHKLDHFRIRPVQRIHGRSLQYMVSDKDSAGVKYIRMSKGTDQDDVSAFPPRQRGQLFNR